MLFGFYLIKKKLKGDKGWKEQENQWDRKRNKMLQEKKRKQRSGRNTGKLSKKKQGGKLKKKQIDKKEERGRNK